MLFNNIRLRTAIAILAVIYLLSTATAAARPISEYIDIEINGISVKTECKKSADKLFIPVESDAFRDLSNFSNVSFSINDRREAVTLNKTSASISYSIRDKKTDSIINVRKKRRNNLYCNVADLANFMGFSYEYKGHRCIIKPVISSITYSNGVLSLSSASSIKNNPVLFEMNGRKNVVRIKNVVQQKDLALPNDTIFQGSYITTSGDDLLLVFNEDQISSLSKATAPSISSCNIKVTTFNPMKVTPEAMVGVKPVKPIEIKRELPKNNRLENIELKDLGDSFSVKISLAGPFSYKWMRLKAPDNRFIVDIPNCKVDLGVREKLYDFQHPLVKNVRAAQFSPEPEQVGRIVISLTSPSSCDIASESENSVTFTFGARFQSPYSLKQSGCSATIKNQEEPVNGNGEIICIDPGHGGGDSGALNRSLPLAEKDVTLDISLKLEKLLKERGYQVIMTRRTDRDVTYAGSPDSEELGARVDIGNRADLFVSVHINANVKSNVNGFTTYWNKKGDNLLAAEVQQLMINATGRLDRGVIRDNFYVISRTNVPAILVEAGFITNMEEARLLTQDSFRQKIAESIANGIGIYISKYGSSRFASSKRASASK